MQHRYRLITHRYIRVIHRRTACVFLFIVTLVCGLFLKWSNNAVCHSTLTGQPKLRIWLVITPKIRTKFVTLEWRHEAGDNKILSVANGFAFDIRLTYVDPSCKAKSLSLSSTRQVKVKSCESEIASQNKAILKFLFFNMLANEYVTFLDSGPLGMIHKESLYRQVGFQMLLPHRPKFIYVKTSFTAPSCCSVSSGLQQLLQNFQNVEIDEEHFTTGSCRPYLYRADLIHQLWSDEEPENGSLCQDLLGKAILDGAKTQRHSPIFIVAAVFDRPNVKSFFRKLSTSHKGSDMILNVHIANNKKSRQGELIDMAEAAANDQAKFFIHTFKRNMGGMARFFLTRELMKFHDFTFVIFIDDDQYVRHSTVIDLWSQRTLLAMTGWYGKKWSSSVESYWMPNIGLEQIQTQAETNDDWDYVGTGLSIVDTLIFSDDRVFKPPIEYYFVEDLWLSYILKVNSWMLLRAFVDVDLEEDLFVNGQSVHMVPKKATMFKKLNACPVPLVKH
jgi:hypothetical protein